MNCLMSNLFFLMNMLTRIPKYISNKNLYENDSVVAIRKCEQET